MKIAAIHTFRLRLPFTDPPATGFLPLTHRELLIVEVRLSSGHVGVGYLHPLIGGLKTLECCVQEMLAPRILGEVLVDEAGEPRVAELWQRLWTGTYIQGRMGITVMAQSAIDIALWDACGKVFGKPLWALWGGSGGPLPIYGSGCFRGSGRDGMIAKAEGYVDAGFRAIKMQVAHTFTPDQDIANVAAMREHLGPDIGLMIDVNQGWDVATAIATGRALEPFDPLWLEEPVVAHDFAGYDAVATALKIPVVGGENHFTHLDLAPFLASGRLPILQPDVMRGGYTDLFETSRRAVAAGIAIAPHLFHELMTHLLASIPNPSWLEYMGWHDDLWIDPVLPVNGFVTPPDRPGHGLDLRPDLLDRYRV
jgi:L-alanine-DL-glutamate epimerase-like enolase superfamily enzyme